MTEIRQVYISLDSMFKSGLCITRAGYRKCICGRRTNRLLRKTDGTQAVLCTDCLIVAVDIAEWCLTYGQPSGDFHLLTGVRLENKGKPRDPDKKLHSLNDLRAEMKDEIPEDVLERAFGIVRAALILADRLSETRGLTPAILSAYLPVVDELIAIYEEQQEAVAL